MSADTTLHNRADKQNRSDAHIPSAGQRELMVPLWLTVLLALVLLGIGIWTRWHTLDIPFDRDGYDEGVYWQSLRAMAAGQPLYQQIFYSQPPFFLLAIFPFFMLFGQTILAARLGIAIISLCGLLGAYLLGKTLAGRTGALVALLLMVGAPLYLTESQTLQAEAPAVALALLAVALAYRWYAQPQGGHGYGYAALTGGVLALSLMSKLFLANFIPVILLALAYLWRSKQQRAGETDRHVWRPLLLATLVFVLTCILLLLPFMNALPQLWQQVITYHTAARIPQLANRGVGPLAAGQFLLSILGLTALYGTIVALRRRDWRIVPLLAWLLATIAFLWQQTPLFTHHLVALIAPLSMLAVMGIEPIRWSRQRSALLENGVTLIGLLLVLGTTLLNGLDIQHTYDRTIILSKSERTLAGIHIAHDLQSQLQPGQRVITDAPFIAGLADRATPAALVDFSEVRALTHYITTQQLIQEAEQPQVQAVLFYYTGHLDRFPEFHSWVTQHFRLVQRYAGPHVADYGGIKELWLK